MEKSSDLKGIKRLLAMLCGLFVVLLVGMIAIQTSVNSFNKKERTYSLAEPTNDIEVTIDKQAYWSKVMPESFILQNFLLPLFNKLIKMVKTFLMEELVNLKL